MRKWIVLTVMALFFSSSSLLGQIKGWFVAGSRPAEYNVRVDNSTHHSGNSSVCIASKQSTVAGFGNVMQTIIPEHYFGKRIRFSGFLKTQDVVGRAALWLRIDGNQASRQQLAFDNMKNRSVYGTTDWTECSIVVDVPMEAGLINYGTLLESGGTVWVDDCRLEVVDKTVPVTDMMPPKSKLSDKPINLDFEE